MSLPDFEELVQLQAFIQKLRNVKRAVYIPGTDEKENDVDHSYSLAMTAWFVAERLDTDYDYGKIVQYALVHDLVEIHAGDTFFKADQDQLDSKQAREAKALKNIEEEWGASFPRMITLIREYEDKGTPEARLVYAVDKLMPMTLHLNDEGRTLKTKKITAEDMLEHKRAKLTVSPEIAEYLPQLERITQEYTDYFYQKDVA